MSIPTAAGLCLNVGCGLSVGLSWLNIDASYSLRLSRIPLIGRAIVKVVGFPAWPDSVKYGDIVKGIRIPKSSCQLVFASHVLEHLSEQDFLKALNNIYSYLCPGGHVRIIVPDLEIYAKEYIQRLTSVDAKISAEANSYFMTKANVGVQRARNHLMGRVRETFANSRHQWMWDAPSLEKALLRIGFHNVRFRKYGEWGDSRFREIEEEDRHVESICAEAQKPFA